MTASLGTGDIVAGLIIGLIAIVMIGWVIQEMEKLKVSATTLPVLRAGSPAAFEHVCANLLRAMGYRNVEVSGGPGDLGADITCQTPSGFRVIAQCKRYGAGKKVGSRDLQLFLGAINLHGASRGIFMTTADGYTYAAEDIARKWSIQLMTGHEIAKLTWDLSDHATA